jgi:hypothetical protein
MSIRYGFVVVCGLICVIGIQVAQADTYVVTNTTDTGPGSLRQAIMDANAHVNINPQAPDNISFAIPGAGLQSIVPASVLPTITDPVVIDGYTQPASAPNTLAVGDNSAHLVELNGNNAAFKALIITAGGSTIRGLVINNFNGNGATTAITLQTLGGNKVEGCFLGLNAAGTAGATNRDFGVDIEGSPNNTIGGSTPAARNVISGNNTGIQVNGTNSAGTIVHNNYIGTNAAGTAALLAGGVSQSVIGIGIGNNGAGTGSSNNVIGGPTAAARNVISGNASTGIKLFDDTITGTVVQGNYIGTDASGLAAIGNGTGVTLLRTNDSVVGGTVAGAGNVISGNNGDGISLDGSRNLIQGNLVGTNAAGTAAVPNMGVGIRLLADGSNAGSDNTIGGTTPSARNIISGNGAGGNGHGIRFELQATTAGNLIQGNYIGTDITGTVALGNAGSGIQIFESQSSTGVNTVGGTTAAARNVISSNGGSGIFGGGHGILIQGNFIGTNASGTGDLGNVAFGLDLACVDQNTIGGSAAGAGNVIGFNGMDGVRVASCSSGGVVTGVNNSILGNSIFSNVRLGINLLGGTEDSFGVTANDPCDTDTAANNLQNSPVLTSVTNASGNVEIVGTLNSTANQTYRLEFFGNDVIDPSGFGEGRYFLGFANVTTDANCNASFDVTFSASTGTLHVTATATDVAGNTSEFSAAIGQLLNISTRLRVETGENVLIGGFIISGIDPKRVVVRGIGPSLAQFFTDFLANPTLELHGPAGFETITNDNWKMRSDGSSQQAEIEATGLAPTSDLESATVQSLPANSAYTAIVRGKDDTSGIGLVEAYDLDAAANSKLANISTRGLVETDNNVMIVGFIAGNGLTKVIIRGIGPSLTQAGISGALQNPALALHDGNGATLASNDDWRIGGQEAEIIATTIPPSDDLEAAIVALLAPGAYTAIVSGVNNTTGVGLVEVYNIRNLVSPMYGSQRIHCR